MLNESLTVGGLHLPNRAFLAPLAGVSDLPFRRACQRMGAGLTYTEMLAANAVVHTNRRTHRTMTRHPDEPLLGAQIGGASPATVAQAVACLDALPFETIDINMGCPIRKIVSRGWGSALLLDPERAARTIGLARAATTKPLSVKIRIGYTRDAVNVEEIVALAVDAGVDMVTIHGRTRDEHYGVPADWEAIGAGVAAARAHVKERLVGERSSRTVAVVGNGDVLTVEDACTLMARVDCDAVMIARGALGNPWIFRDALVDQVAPLGVAEWLDVVLSHMACHAAFYGDGVPATALFRKHLLWYTQGWPDSARLRDQLGVAGSFKAVEVLLRQFAETLPEWITRTPSFEFRLNRERS
jgi:nifR3 family TIM-barrel protein